MRRYYDTYWLVTTINKMDGLACRMTAHELPDEPEDDMSVSCGVHRNWFDNQVDARAYMNRMLN